ncbi:MAG: HNH endonuclease signature motif containing protein [Methylococcales bacterium]|nr:HNH endonuclease signature motif containing protein [Methylococcales bacterium]
MDLLAYWRYDNYLRDLDAGAGFHFNSNQSRLHTEIHIGEKLWLFTRVVNAGRNEYRLLARLNVSAKTINAPTYKYGPYRIWGDIRLSRYFRANNDSKEDVFELLRLLEFDGASLQSKDRTSLAQACQTIRVIRPSASKLLESFAEILQDEPRAKAVPDEEKLEQALYAPELASLNQVLELPSVAYAEAHKQQLRQSQERNRQLVLELQEKYFGRCQVTGHDSPLLYGVPTAEAHHIVYRSRGGEDVLENMVLLSPNLHRAIHSAEAHFDYNMLSFVFSNGRVEPLVLNRHLQRRTL